MAITDPTGIANLLAWYGADVGVTVTTGGVSLWDNQEGTANHDLVMAVDDQKPDLILNGAPSGLNSIRFLRNITVGQDDRLNTSDETFAPNDDYTISMAIRLPLSSSDRETMLRCRISGFNENGLFSKLADDTLAFEQFDFGSPVVVLTGFTLGAWHIITITVTAADLVTIRIDGVQRAQGTSTGLVSWAQGFRLGAKGSPESANVDYGALVIYDRVLTATELTDIETYLDTKWLQITPPPPLTHSSQTNLVGLGPFFFTDIELFPQTVEPLHNQLRVFKKDASNVVTELFPLGREDFNDRFQWQFDSLTNPTAILLETGEDLIATDTLVILRETRVDKPLADISLTGASRVRADDLNTRGDQILFVCQEYRELRDVADILGSGSGASFEYGTATLDTSPFEQTSLGDGVKIVFSYNLIEMLPKGSVSHAANLLVFVDNALQTFTVDEDAVTITITSGTPGSGAIIKIRRVTRIDKRWVQHVDAQTFSSLLMDWDFKNIKFLIEETIDFPIFVKSNPLDNRIFARPINEITYSGPGDRFSFANLPFFGDGFLFVFLNETPLTSTDFSFDLLLFDILLNLAILTGDSLRIEVTNPFHAFDSLPFANPNPVTVTEVDEEFVVEGDLIVLQKYITEPGDVITDHTKMEIGDTVLQSGEAGAILMLRSGDLGTNFPGSTITEATITITNVLVNTLFTGNKFDFMNATFVGDTLYATLAGKYLSPTTVPSIPPSATGKQVLDAKDAFQALADLDTISEAFVIGHEEPFPTGAASSGRIETAIRVEFRVLYSVADEDTGSATSYAAKDTDSAHLKQKCGLAPGEYATAFKFSDGLGVRADANDSFTPVNIRIAQVMRFNLVGFPASVTTARLVFDKIRWNHATTTSESPLPVKARRLTAIPFDPNEGTWQHQDKDSPAAEDPGVAVINWPGAGAPITTDIPGCPTPATVGSPTGGGTTTSDHTATGGVQLEPPTGLINNTIVESNVTLFGIETMLNAALTAGDPFLEIVFFMDLFTGPITNQSVNLNFSPTLPDIGVELLLEV